MMYISSMKLFADVEQILFSDTQLYFLLWFSNHSFIKLENDMLEEYEHAITKKSVFKVRYKTLFFLKNFIVWFLDFNILIEDEPRRDRFYAEES